MIIDRFGGQHSSTSQQAVHAFEDAVAAVAAHRPLGDSLDRTLNHDPDFCAGIALQGLGTVLLAKSADLVKASDIGRKAKACLKKLRNGTSSEQALVKALELSAEGQMQAASASIEDYLLQHPTDFLAVKLAHAFRFMSGQPDRMLATTATVLPAWTVDNGGYGYLLGCHAFGLEECGHHREAETTGRKGVELEPADAWGLHAVGHVMEMNGRTQEGATWLGASRPLWPKCNNFGFHLAWHLSLFQLEMSDHMSVLKLYDESISPEPSSDFRDMANAASVLWRLEQDGIDVGPRWEALRAVAHDQRRDGSYNFASLHNLLVLAATGDQLGTIELVEEMHARAKDQSCDQGKVAAKVGAKLATIILASRRPNTHSESFNLVEIANNLQLIGGSHAQRDVFLRTLLLFAADIGDQKQVEAIARIRLQQRCADRFVNLVERRLLKAAEVNRDFANVTSSTMFH